VIVLDSSSVVEWLLGLPQADAVGERIVSADSLHAPALLDVEVAQVVRRYTAVGEIGAEAGERALVALSELDVNRYTHELLLPLIWRLRHNVTAYDAAFLALAAALDAPLLTLDARLARTPLPPLLGRSITIDVLN
jgi:predicted nucleic acid-binding protein